MRGKGGYKYHIKGRVLKQYDNRRGRGYLFVNVNVNGKQFHLYVHRAVATCFIPNPNDLPEVNHIDNNPKNNIVSNLEWCTHEYNTEYREKYGIPAKEFSKVLRKPVIAINLESFKVFWFESQNDAAYQLGANQGRISDVVNGKLNKTHGYWFCRVNKHTIEKAIAKFGDEVASKVENLIGGELKLE